MKMTAKDMFYQSLATAKNEGDKATLEVEKLEKHMKQVMAEHFSTIQPLLGCTTCKYADKASLGDSGCCTHPDHQGPDDQYFTKSDDAPICSSREEGEPKDVPAPSFEDFLRQMTYGKKRGMSETKAH